MMALRSMLLLWFTVLSWLAVIVSTETANMATDGPSRPRRPTGNRARTSPTRTALDEYVERPDPTYCYRVLPRILPAMTVTAGHWNLKTNQWLQGVVNTYVLNMTSQTWLSGHDVANPVWWHYMTVSIPETVRREDTALLIINGGKNTDDPPEPLTDHSVQFFARIARKLQMVVANVYQVPNNPVTFLDSIHSESLEDSFDDDSSDRSIAHSWRLFIENKTDNADWIMQLPMTKAVVRAMDTVTSFANSKINRFYLSGASKRGWIAWTTAAVDDRVVGITPIVMDMVNLPSNIMHHFRSLGGWSFSLEPYWSQNIASWIRHPNFRRLVDIIDPLKYRDRLTMPKLLITAGNDQNFLPDSSHYFYDRLVGTNFLRIVPNALHEETGEEATHLLPNFILMLEEKWPLPKMVWSRTENSTHGMILVTTNIQPVRVGGWVAISLSGTRRDFRRLMAKKPGSADPVPQDVRYTLFEVDVLSPTSFRAVVNIPDHRWACFFVELQYLAPDNEIISVTTEVNIVPSTFPTKSCRGEECISHLV